MQSNGNHRLKSFYILLAGQGCALLGNGMTRFALMLWAFEQQKSATTLALLGFFSCITYVVVSPFAGVLVDRRSRRGVLLLAGVATGAGMAALMGLFAAGRLQIWHLYLMESLLGVILAFQDPVLYSSVSLMVPAGQYTRANGLLGLINSASKVLTPVLAGLLLKATGLGAMMSLNLSLVLLGLLSLGLVHIPVPPASTTGRAAMGNFWKESRFGTGYILRRPGLRGLISVHFLINLFATTTYFAVLTPMILARPGGGETAFSIVRSVMGIGGVAGGLLIAVWGGPRRKVATYLWATALSFLVCDFLTATSRSVLGWSAAGFLSELTIPFIVSPYFALWQERVPADVQGRVFATREMVVVTSQPIGYLAGGLLADRLFEPALANGGVLAGTLGHLVGTGPGAGMAAMFLCTSLLGFLTGMLGLGSPAIRALDEEKAPALLSEEAAIAGD